MSGPLELLVGLLAPDAASGAYNDWRLVFTHTWPAWTQVVLPIVLAVAVLASATGLSRASRARRWLLIALRAVVALGVLALFLQPAVELRAVSRVRTRVALMLDASRSMGLATPEGTRAQAVARHLAESQADLRVLGDRAVVEPVLFGERIHPVDAVPAVLPTEEPRTDLARALSEVGWQSAGRELGAFIRDGGSLTPPEVDQIQPAAESPPCAPPPTFRRRRPRSWP